MEKKEDTPVRIARRKYEERNKDERKALNKVFGTSIPRETCEEIEAFLQAHHISKVDLIMTGYITLMEQYRKSK
jgi:hypothetical protein